MSAVSHPAPLSPDALDGLPAAVDRPGYARADLTAGILHFGPGNFHRAHQAVYLDRLMESGEDHDWAILGASVMPGDAALRDALLGQGCLNTVVSESATESEARVTGAMVGYLPIADAGAILEAMGDPGIRIVSLTVTEGGYFVDAVTNRFDAHHPAILADAANIDAPATVFGMIVRALAARRDANAPAFTVMSCDNLPHNGRAAKAAVIGLATLVDAELAAWIGANSRLPQRHGGPDHAGHGAARTLARARRVRRGRRRAGVLRGLPAVGARGRRSADGRPALRDASACRSSTTSRRSRR